MSLFDQEKFLSLLRSRRLGRPLYYFESTDSSNSRLQNLAAQNAPEGSLVLAESQSAGRGRWGRSWESPPGKNLLFSFLLRPGRGVLTQLAPVFGLAVVQALKIGKLKWPNDIWINGKKAGGLLIEGNAEALIVGIGLNVNQSLDDFSDELKGQATSLWLESGQKYDRELLLAELLNACEDAYDQWQSQGFERFRSLWNENALFMGESVLAGNRQGRALGLDADGALLFETPQGIEKLVSGEVFGLRPVLD